MQTLSNHTPYALPDPLPVPTITGYGSLNEHLTSMHYADWALGQFFEKIKHAPYYHNTLFVLVGDHGFATHRQLTDIDLLRFHVPLLLIGPGITPGDLRHRVGSQVDIAPTIAGQLGGVIRHNCWGRDLLSLPEEAGFAIIKPSSHDPVLAYVANDRALVYSPDNGSRLYRYRFGEPPQSKSLNEPDIQQDYQYKLFAYVQATMQTLLRRGVGQGEKNAP